MNATLRLTPKRMQPAQSKYRKIIVNGVRIDEHRHIMQVHLGRDLLHDETVHHKNGDTYDNRIENLEVIDRAAHSRMHAKTILTTEQVLAIRASSLGNAVLARQHGVTRHAIRSIRLRISWRHI